MNEIKGLCFAVVVENTDKLYFKDTSQKSNESIVLEDGHRLSEHLCVRLANYARLRSSNALLDDIYNYYTCTRMLDDDEIAKQYEKYKVTRNGVYLDQMLVLFAETVNLDLIQSGIHDHDILVVRRTSAAGNMRTEITLRHTAETLVEHTVHDLANTAVFS